MTAVQTVLRLLEPFDDDEAVYSPHNTIELKLTCRRGRVPRRAGRGVLRAGRDGQHATDCSKHRSDNQADLGGLDVAGHEVDVGGVGPETRDGRSERTLGRRIRRLPPWLGRRCLGDRIAEYHLLGSSGVRSTPWLQWGAAHPS
jgi:hypothetical protein